MPPAANRRGGGKFPEPVTDRGRPDGEGEGAGTANAPQEPRSKPDLAENGMLDVVFLASTVVFFLVSLAYVWGCDGL